MTKKLSRKAISKAVEEARKRMSIKHAYTVEIEDYLITRIEEQWTPILKKHNMIFSPESMIHAVVKSAADKIMMKELKKMGIKTKKIKV